MNKDEISNQDPDRSDQQLLQDFETHRQLVTWLFGISLAVITVVAVLLLCVAFPVRTAGGQPLDFGESVSIVEIVVLAGTLGAFISALSRLYKLDNFLPLARYSGLLKNARTYVVIYSCIPALVGMIAALALHLIFAAGMVQGALFPEFHCQLSDPNGCNEFNAFVTHWSPKSATDYAKDIVWAFIAGFSERFVPNILGNLAKTASDRNEAQST